MFLFAPISNLDVLQTYATGVQALFIRVLKSTPENPLILSASVDVD